MQIYKLFATNKKIPKLNLKHFINRNKIFGVEINPENYRDFMKEYYDVFNKNKVYQHIMTNYKYISLIENYQNLNIDILSIKFKEDDELRNTGNEIYFEILDYIDNRNIKPIVHELQELIEEGFNICKLECSVKFQNAKKERLHIYDNGTIAFSQSVENMQMYFNESKIIDYLVKGLI